MTLTIGTPVTSATPNNINLNTYLDVALATTTVGHMNVIEISGCSAGTLVNPGMSTPDGWTKLFERMDTNGTPASFVAVFRRKFQAGDSSPVRISWTNVGNMVAICTPWSGQHATTPIPYSTSDYKVASDVNYSIAGTTGSDAGYLCYGFANRTGSAWSSLSDNARGSIGLSSSSTMVGRVTAAKVNPSTAFTKTAVGSNTSVGVSWAYVVMEAPAAIEGVLNFPDAVKVGADTVSKIYSGTDLIYSV